MILLKSFSGFKKSFFKKNRLLLLFITLLNLFSGFEKIIQMLIEKGANVNAVTEYLFISALEYAIRYGKISNKFIAIKIYPISR